MKALRSSPIPPLRGPLTPAPAKLRLCRISMSSLWRNSLASSFLAFQRFTLAQDVEQGDRGSTTEAKVSLDLSLSTIYCEGGVQ
jgi:hypothetical protein